jgi:hypothetical protein
MCSGSGKAGIVEMKTSNRFTEVLRFVVRILATPVVVFSFGFFWLGFLLFIGPAFQIVSFVENERFDWRAHFADCNEFFCEPLAKMWKG